MLIGLTYDLRSYYLARGLSPDQVAEFDSEETVQALADTLGGLGYAVDPIGSLPELMPRLAAGQRWDLVFNIAEGLGGYGREAQVPALLDYHGIPYTFSDPLALCLSLHKGAAKRVMRDAGLPTPDFAVVTKGEPAHEVDLPYPLFVKPVAEGTGRGIGLGSLCRAPAELAEACGRIWEQCHQPALVETYLPGREFTVGILGTGPDALALGVLEVELLAEAEAHAYSYHNKENCESLVQYRLAHGPQAREAARLALEAWRALGCRDAGRVDLRCGADGQPQLMELNPLAGLHPQHSDLPILCSMIGMPYQELIAAIVKSALATNRALGMVLAAPDSGMAGREAVR